MMGNAIFNNKPTIYTRQCIVTDYITQLQDKAEY